jgi:hypothetical protein
MSAKKKKLKEFTLKTPSKVKLVFSEGANSFKDMGKAMFIELIKVKSGCTQIILNLLAAKWYKTLKSTIEKLTKYQNP